MGSFWSIGRLRLKGEAMSKCSEKVWSGHNWYPCPYNAKVERSGKGYCGRHDPEAVKAKRAKRHADWSQERDQKRNEQEARATIMQVAYELRYSDERLRPAFDSLMANSTWRPKE
jgi:hypothetical protein